MSTQLAAETRTGASRLPVLEEIAELLAKRPFEPHRFLRSAHLQTIVASRLPREFPWGWKQSSEETLELENGCRVRALFVDRSIDAPVLIGLHGLGGSSESCYMQGLSHKAYREGWNAVLFSLYDLNLEGRCPTLFHAGTSSELAQLLGAVRRRRPWKTYYLAGISMGGNILLKLLGEWGSSTPAWLGGAAAISPLVDLERSWTFIEKPSNTLYRLHFIGRLKRALRRRSAQLKHCVDLSKLDQVRTFRDFDEHITAPMGGFSGAMDYYRRASSAPLLPRITRPTLVIHAKDDPLLPWEPWTRHQIQANPAILPHLTDRGGHVGFLEHLRRDVDRAWAENRVIDFFRLLRSGA